MQDAPDFLEAANTAAQLRQFGQGGVGTAAAVEQAVDLVHDRAQRQQLRLPSADTLQRFPFAVAEVVLHKEVAMIKQVADSFLQTLPSAGGPLGGPRARSATRQARLLACEVFADLGDGPQHGLGQFLENMELANLMRDRPENLGNRLGIQRRRVSCDGTDLEATLLQSRLETLEKRDDVGMRGIVVQHLISQTLESAIVYNGQDTEGAVVEFIRRDVAGEVGQSPVQVADVEFWDCLFSPRPPPSSG